MMKNLRKNKTMDILAIKCERGEILRNKTEVMRRPNKYFKKLLKTWYKAEMRDYMMK